jgi:acyl-CoA thioesterase-1
LLATIMGMTTRGRAKRLPYSLLLLLAITGGLACGQGAEAPPLASPAAAAPEAPDERRVVVFLGTSLTAGYGLSADESFPALIQERIDEEGLSYRVVNAGVSGDTSAGGLRRLDWLLRQPIAVLVLELGANDMLRGQGIEAMRENLQRIVDLLREAHPDATLLVAGMRAAPNLGEAYVTAFEASYRELALRNDGVLLPFLLEGVAADPALNQADGIHPTVEGQRLVAENVWVALRPLLD